MMHGQKNIKLRCLLTVLNATLKRKNFIICTSRVVLFCKNMKLGLG